MARKVKSLPRICPYCLFVEGEGGHITASFIRKKADGTSIGGCGCPECDGLWEEFAYRDGRTLLKLRNGRMVDEDELRAEVEKGMGE